MINVIIYVREEQQPKDIVQFLLQEKLIASASIDENNVLYKMCDDQLVQEIYSVITCQSKALLFDEIVHVVEQKLGEKIAIHSIPIVGANGYFNDSVKKRTLLI